MTLVHENASFRKLRIAFTTHHARTATKPTMVKPAQYLGYGYKNIDRNTTRCKGLHTKHQ